MEGPDDNVLFHFNWASLYSHALMPVAVAVLAAGAHQLRHRYKEKRERHLIGCLLVGPAVMLSLSILLSLLMHLGDWNGQPAQVWFTWTEFIFNIASVVYFCGVLITLGVGLRKQKTNVPGPPGLYVGTLVVGGLTAIPLFCLMQRLWYKRQRSLGTSTHHAVAVEHFHIHTQWHYAISFVILALSGLMVELTDRYLQTVVTATAAKTAPSTENSASVPCKAA